MSQKRFDVKPFQHEWNGSKKEADEKAMPLWKWREKYGPKTEPEAIPEKSDVDRFELPIYPPIYRAMALSKTEVFRELKKLEQEINQYLTTHPDKSTLEALRIVGDGKGFSPRDVEVVKSLFDGNPYIFQLTEVIVSPFQGLWDYLQSTQDDFETVKNYTLQYVQNMDYPQTAKDSITSVMRGLFDKASQGIDPYGIIQYVAALLHRSERRGLSQEEIENLKMDLILKHAGR